MSQNLRDYTKTLYTMDGVVRRVKHGDWDNQSPNDNGRPKKPSGM